MPNKDSARAESSVNLQIQKEQCRMVRSNNTEQKVILEQNVRQSRTSLCLSSLVPKLTWLGVRDDGSYNSFYSSQSIRASQKFCCYPPVLEVGKLETKKEQRMTADGSLNSPSTDSTILWIEVNFQSQCASSVLGRFVLVVKKIPGRRPNLYFHARHANINI